VTALTPKSRRRGGGIAGMTDVDLHTISGACRLN